MKEDGEPGAREVFSSDFLVTAISQPTQFYFVPVNRMPSLGICSNRYCRIVSIDAGQFLLCQVEKDRA
jgi:hypothetical protein